VDEQPFELPVDGGALHGHRGGSGLPALLLHGVDDDVLAPRTAERFVEAYARAGGVIELAEYPRAGHGFAREPGPNAARALDLMKSFIARQLGAIAAGW